MFYHYKMEIQLANKKDELVKLQKQSNAISLKINNLTTEIEVLINKINNYRDLTSELVNTLYSREITSVRDYAEFTMISCAYNYEEFMVFMKILEKYNAELMEQIFVENFMVKYTIRIKQK